MSTVIVFLGFKNIYHKTKIISSRRQKHKRAVVCLGHKADFDTNKDFRYYTITNETYSIAQLPCAITPPKDCEKFSIETLQNNDYWRILDLQAAYD